MSTKPLLLEGETGDLSVTRGLADLRERVDGLESDVNLLRQQLEHSQKENYKIIARLLSPLYKSLKPIFGEIEEVSDSPSAGSAPAKGVWDDIKQRLAPRLREAVDILILQKTMKRTQLASALRMHYSNCNKNVIGPLLRQGWLVDNGGNLSLKQL